MASLVGPLKLPKVGSTLDDKYTLESVLGRGGMAIVYEATHIKLRQKVAIKMLLPSVCDMPDTVKRFEREARAAVQLRGSNVARVLDVDTTPAGLPFIVMEFLVGHDLAEEMAKRGQITIDDAVSYVLQVCSAMYEAHALGLIHRDLKPSNLFVCESPGARVVKVLDFGIVKLESGESTVTRAETVLGTPAYMSPEQIRSATTVDVRTDIWSLGVILYELLASELPFDGASAPVMSNAILHAPPKALKPRRPDVPDGLVDVVMKALAKDADDRFSDIKELADAVAPFGAEPKTWTPPTLQKPISVPVPRGSRPDADGEYASLDDTRTISSRPPGSRTGGTAPEPRMGPRSGRGSSPNDATVAANRPRTMPDLSRTASAPRITPALGLGGLAILAGVGFMAFMMGRGNSSGSWQPNPAAVTPAPSVVVSARVDAGVVSDAARP